MRYLVSVNDLNEKTEYITKQLMIIDENIEALKKIESAIVWEGESATKFINNHNNYIKDLSNIEKNALSINKYLMNYANSYGSEYGRLINKYSKAIERGK